MPEILSKHPQMKKALKIAKRSVKAHKAANSLLGIEFQNNVSVDHIIALFLMSIIPFLDQNFVRRRVEVNFIMSTKKIMKMPPLKPNSMN